VRAAGVNRVSMGVQSFSEEQLVACGRGHGVTEVEEGVGFLRKAGFNDLSLDIMSGLPGDSVQVKSPQAARRRKRGCRRGEPDGPALMCGTAGARALTCTPDCLIRSHVRVLAAAPRELLQPESKCIFPHDGIATHSHTPFPAPAPRVRPRRHTQGLERSLARAVALGPTHLSVYDLIVEEGTAFWRWYGGEDGEGPRRGPRGGGPRGGGGAGPGGRRVRDLPSEDMAGGISLSLCLSRSLSVSLSLELPSEDMA
jgi:hypothetical protein